MVKEEFFKRFYFQVINRNRCKVLDTYDGVVEEYKLQDVIDNVSSFLGLSTDNARFLIFESKLAPKVVEGAPQSMGTVDRTLAVTVIRGKVYEDTDHQGCFEQYMKGWWKKFGLDLNNGYGYDTACQYTDAWFKHDMYYGFSLFNDSVLVAHYRENLVKCWGVIKEYADKNGYSLGYSGDKFGDVIPVTEVVF